MGNNDDVLSQNLQVMEIGNFQVKKGAFYPPTKKKTETVKFTTWLVQ